MFVINWVNLFFRAAHPTLVQIVPSAAGVGTGGYITSMCLAGGILDRNKE